MMAAQKGAPEIRTDADVIAGVAQACRDGTRSEIEIRECAEMLISGLRKLSEYGPATGNRKANKRYLQDVKRRLDDLDAAIRKVPPEFPVSLLFSSPRGSSLEAIFKDAEARWEYFSGEFAQMRTRCDGLLRAKIGEHGLGGYQQERAAVAACDLMDFCGLPRAWSSPTSPYRRVAGLFFEAMTGEYGRELERACETIAPKRIQTEKG